MDYIRARQTFIKINVVEGAIRQKYDGRNNGREQRTFGRIYGMKYS